jgi:hypothetical protein
MRCGSRPAAANEAAISSPENVGWTSVWGEMIQEEQRMRRQLAGAFDDHTNTESVELMDPPDSFGDLKGLFRIEAEPRIRPRQRFERHEAPFVQSPDRLERHLDCVGPKKAAYRFNFHGGEDRPGVESLGCAHIRRNRACGPGSLKGYGPPVTSRCADPLSAFCNELAGSRAWEDSPRRVSLSRARRQ